MNKIKKIIHDVKMNPNPFCYGLLLGLILTFPFNIMPILKFYLPFSPDWKKLEIIISDDIFSTKKLFQYSTTDEETALIEELLTKQYEFKMTIPQGKKERKDFLKKYNNETGLIITKYKSFLYENDREGNYLFKKK